MSNLGIQSQKVEKEIAILIADLTGYTAMTDVHGGVSAAKMVSKYMKIVGLAVHGKTKVVQRIGDQVVMIAKDPSDLLTTAKQLNALIIEEHHFLSIHAGLHYGTIIVENGNLFGSTINIAARIMNLASSRQILCSSFFQRRLSANEQKLFKSIGVHKLKNVMSDIELFELVDTTMNPFKIDPVCHMHVASNKQSLTLEYQGITYHFCSDHCMSLFRAAPERFIGEARHL